MNICLLIVHLFTCTNILHQIHDKRNMLVQISKLSADDHTNCTKLVLLYQTVEVNMCEQLAQSYIFHTTSL